MSVSYNTKMVTDSLVLNLDFANIKSYSGSGTTTLNSIGSEQFTVYGSPTFSNNGFQIRESYSSPRIQGTIDYDILRQSGTTKAWTLEVCAKLYTSTQGNGNGWLGEHTLMGRTGWHSGIMLFDNQIYGHIKSSNANGWSGALSTSGGYYLTNGQTYHIVFTYNNKLGKIYINGEYFSLGYLSSESLIQDHGTQLNFSIGGSSPNMDLYFGRAYTKELSANEVKQNFNAIRGRYSI